jgi:hypothetical protein
VLGGTNRTGREKGEGDGVYMLKVHFIYMYENDIMKPTKKMGGRRRV